MVGLRPPPVSPRVRSTEKGLLLSTVLPTYSVPYESGEEVRRDGKDLLEVVTSRGIKSLRGSCLVPVLESFGVQSMCEFFICLFRSWSVDLCGDDVAIK